MVIKAWNPNYCQTKVALILSLHDYCKGFYLNFYYDIAWVVEGTVKDIRWIDHFYHNTERCITTQAKINPKILCTAENNISDSGYFCLGWRSSKNQSKQKIGDLWGQLNDRVLHCHCHPLVSGILLLFMMGAPLFLMCWYNQLGHLCFLFWNSRKSGVTLSIISKPLKPYIFSGHLQDFFPDLEFILQDFQNGPINFVAKYNPCVRILDRTKAEQNIAQH